MSMCACLIKLQTIKKKIGFYKWENEREKKIINKLLWLGGTKPMDMYIFKEKAGHIRVSDNFSNETKPYNWFNSFFLK